MPFHPGNYRIDLIKRTLKNHFGDVEINAQRNKIGNTNHKF